LHKADREIYQSVYNYYVNRPQNKLFLTNSDECYCQSTIHEEKNLSTPDQQRKFVNKIFREINNIKKFLLNYQLMN
jgi:hypothetical protein